MKRLLLILAASVAFFVDVDSTQAQNMPPSWDQHTWWFGDWQNGLPLWPPAIYWDPAAYPSPGPFYYLRKQHFGKAYIMEAPPPPAIKPDLPAPKPLPPEPAKNQARIDVSMPDKYGLLYVNDQKTSAGIQYYLVPDLRPGQTYSINLRAAFRQGSELLIEEKKVEVKAGGTIAVDFKGMGTNVTRIPLSPDAQKQLAGK